MVLMIPGFVFFWTLLRVDPVPKKYLYAVAMWITGAEVIGDAFFGIAVIADQNLLGAAYYHALARPWGPSLATDQVLGGGVLWILGDLVGLPFLAAQLIHMMREDESDAARIDAELDAEEAARQAKVQALSSPAEPGPPAASAEPGPPAAPAESGRRPPGRVRRAGRGRSRPGPGRRAAPVVAERPPLHLAVQAHPLRRAHGLDGAPDEQRPAAGQFLVAGELVRLHHAPGRHVGVGRRVVGQDRDDRAQRDVPDLLREHDDRDRALPAERVDGQHGSQVRRWHHGPFGLDGGTAAVGTAAVGTLPSEPPPRRRDPCGRARRRARTSGAGARS